MNQPLEKWNEFFNSVYKANDQKAFIRNPMYVTEVGTAAPILPDFAWNAHFQMVGMHMGIAYDEPEKGVQCIYESEYAKRMLELWDSYFEAGYVQGMPQGGANGLSIRSTEMQSLAAYDVTGVGTIAYPLQEQSYATNGPTKTDMAFLVFKNTPDKEIIFQFLNQMATDQEFAKSICIDELGAAFVLWTPLAQSLTPVIMNPAPVLSGEKEDREQLISYYEAMQEAPASGFVFDSQPVEEQVQRMSACNQVTIKMATGDTKADWESYKQGLADTIQSLHEAGMDEALEEANRQLQAFGS